MVVKRLLECLLKRLLHLYSSSLEFPSSWSLSFYINYFLPRWSLDSPSIGVIPSVEFLLLNSLINSLIHYIVYYEYVIQISPTGPSELLHLECMNTFLMDSTCTNCCITCCCNPVTPNVPPTVWFPLTASELNVPTLVIFVWF